MTVDASRPIFIQLAEQIEGRILDGTYPEETQVPSTNEFAVFMRINPATAGKALNRLVDTGVLYKKRGIGMFVAAGAREGLKAGRRERFREEFVLPLLDEAARLGIETGQLLDMIGQPTALTTHPKGWS